LVTCKITVITHFFFFFFDIIELKNASTITIKEAILQVLEKYKIDFEFLKKKIISFVSDGASNMLGRNAGVVLY
jgi:hypothetical protein